MQEGGMKMICYDQASRTDVYFQGIRDYEVLKKKHDYIIFVLSPCRDSRLTAE